MQKVAVSFLLTIYLFSNTEAYQFLKIPVIIQHFQEHRKINPGINLLDFLDIHYMHGSPRDADYGRDMKLPFKIVNHPFNNPPISLPAQGFEAVRSERLLADHQFTIQDDNNLPAAFTADIFQPPRVSL